MADEQKGVVAAGFALMWRRRGVLWWVFVVNLGCGVLGAIPSNDDPDDARGAQIWLDRSLLAASIWACSMS